VVILLAAVYTGALR